jgi:hypothetical protein
LGVLAVGQAMQATQTLIVNGTTKPGAYPIKVSFVYNDAANTSYTDDQVITLLVISRPQVEISFYIEPAPLFAGQPGSLPLQLVNTGANSRVFGNFSVSAPGAQFFNNTVFVGALEPGGFFPLDAQITPDMPGPLELTISVSYTDDFNQPQTITKIIPLEVMEGFVDPGFPPDGGYPPDGGFPDDGSLDGGGDTAQEETFLDKLWRFIKGLLGLDSGIPEPSADGGIPVDGGIPPEGEFIPEGNFEGGVEVVPVR